MAIEQPQPSDILDSPSHSNLHRIIAADVGATIKTIIVDSSSNVGIGTATPNQLLTIENSMSLKEIASANADTEAYGQLWVKTATPNELWFTNDVGTDVQLGAAGGGPGMNVEILSNNKTLTVGVDEMYQYLDPGSADRIITLATAGATAGDRFVVRHNGVFNSDYKLRTKQATLDVEFIYSGGIKEFIFDGANWISGANGTGEYGTKKYNVALGYAAKGYNYGASVGYNSDGHAYGAALGYNAKSYGDGVAVGYGSLGYTSGISIGYGSRADTGGVAVGKEAEARNYGIGIGYYAYTRYNGISIGAYAGDNLSASNPNRNILIGYQAGNSITTGNNNLIIGYDKDTPTATTDNHLNIGGIIYGDLISGNIGIGVIAPDTALDVDGAITTRELSADPSDPDEGSNVTWQSDGTGSGDDGDVMMKITAGGSTKTVTLVDFSAA